MNEHNEDSFMTTTAVNLLETALFQLKFFLRDDTEYSVTTIVPSFFVNKFKKDLELFVEDAYAGNLGSHPENIYDVFTNLPSLDFDATMVEAVDIEWALYFPVTGFPSWLEGHSL